MGNHATSILVLLKHTNQETGLTSAIGDGKVLWSGNTGFEWIGPGNEEWDSVFLVHYEDDFRFQQAVERFREKNIDQIRLFAVRLGSKRRLRLIRFLMKYIFSRASVKLRDEVPDPDTVQSGILPRKEQHARIVREDRGLPIVMVNFLKYHDIPKYPSDFAGERGGDGEEAYNRYGTQAMRSVAKLGGVIENMGDIESQLLGNPNEEWNQFGLMRYHSLDALQGMFRLEENVEAGIHRDAGLKTTRVYAFTPNMIQ
ncbi:MAG: hypothetical protein RTU63_06065 [Candidatus Thorarchaeota archaeon]